MIIPHSITTHLVVLFCLVYPINLSLLVNQENHHGLENNQLNYMISISLMILPSAPGGPTGPGKPCNNKIEICFLLIDH
jgi:hypothetical protein